MLSEMKRNNFLAMCFGLSLCLALIPLFEVTLTLFWKNETPAGTVYAENYFFKDSHGIIKPLPNGRYRSVSRRKKNGSLIYDVIYSIDKYSRRIAPALNKESRVNDAIFFGCSFTYGEGLQDDQSIPARFAARAPAFMPYNYAFHGGSAADMLTKLKSGTLKGEIPEKNGALVYIFIDAHIQRVIGSMSVAGSWGKEHPYYDLNSKDAVIDKGDFLTGRPFLTHLYIILSKSKLINFFKIDFPLRLSSRNIHLTARVIEESFRAYKEQFPAGHFYVVIYPGSLQGKFLIPELSKMGIETVDYSGLINVRDMRYVLAPEDLHPSALAADKIGGQLALDIDVRYGKMPKSI